MHDTVMLQSEGVTEGSLLLSEEDGNVSKQFYLSRKSTSQPLRKSLGYRELFPYVIGSLIGSGIYISPGLVAKYSTNMGMALIIWVISGVICLFGSLCFCELAMTVKKTGGEYIFIKETYGDLAGFCAMWALLLVISPLSVAVVAVAIGEHIADTFSDLSTQNGIWMVKFISITCLFTSFLINAISISFTNRTQAFFSALQILSMVFLITVGIWNIAKGNIHNYAQMFTRNDSYAGGENFAVISAAFYSALWSFDGWGVICSITEELHNPEKDLWFAIVTGIPFVIACYILINLAFMSVLSHAEMASSPTVATLFIQKSLGTKFGLIVPILVALNCFGCLNANFFFESRSFLSASREGHLPEPLSYIHKKRHTLLPALLSLFFPSIIWVLALGSGISKLITYFSFAIWFTYGAAIFAVIILRFKEPNLARPFKVWIANPILMTFASLYLIIAPFFQSPYECSICLGILLLSIPMYYLLIHGVISAPPLLKSIQEFVYNSILHHGNLVMCVYEEIDVVNADGTKESSF